MKTIHTILLLIVLLGFVLINSCKPDKPKAWQTFGPFYLGELADYVCFKPGTVWIYKNPANSQRDTVKVNYGKRWVDTLIDEENRQKIIKETFFSAFGFSFMQYNGNFRDVKFTLIGRGDMGWLHHIDFGKTIQGGPGGTILAMRYPFDKKLNPDPSSIIPGFESTILISKDTTVTVHGRTFSKVQVFKNTRDGTWDGWQTIYFWASGFGIVYRKNLQTNEEWYLESETIIQ